MPAIREPRKAWSRLAQSPVGISPATPSTLRAARCRAAGGFWQRFAAAGDSGRSPRPGGCLRTGRVSSEPSSAESSGARGQGVRTPGPRHGAPRLIASSSFLACVRRSDLGRTPSHLWQSPQCPRRIFQSL